MHSLILVEGQTELEFYRRVAEEYFPRVPRTIRNLHGSINVNRKVLDKVVAFAHANPGVPFRVCVCLDQERPGGTPINWELLRRELEQHGLRPPLVDVIVELMTESVFFVDIDGIYRFLRAPRSSRTTKRFAQYRRLTHRDLSRLFERFGRCYVKGHAIENFVANLEIRKIVAKCAELGRLVKACACG